MIQYIVNTDNDSNHSLLSHTSQTILGGVDSIQWRHKGDYNLFFISFGQKLCALCKEAKIPFIVNDRADIALALDADGVHLGQTDLPIQVIRKIVGQKKIIGGTASTLQEGINVEKEGADYVSFGHIFETKTKKKSYPPIGLDVLYHATRMIHIPIYAIGGITEHNLQAVWKTGIDCVAIVSAIASADHPREMIKKLKSLINE